MVGAGQNGVNGFFLVLGSPVSSPLWELNSEEVGSLRGRGCVTLSIVSSTRGMYSGMVPASLFLFFSPWLLPEVMDNQTRSRTQ